MKHDPDGFLRHIARCTDAVLPGGRTRLRIGAAAVGWVAEADAPGAALADGAAFDRYVEGRRLAGAFRPRGEMFDVRDEASGAVVATVDRGAVPLLGIVAEGVHVNGLVRRADGLHLWVGTRAANKRMDPGKLDHLVAGGIAAGMDAMTTLEKEAGEEASVPPALARTARAVGCLSYAMVREEGLRRDRLHCYDLWLAEDFVPRPNDDEVVSFDLWPVERVAARVAAGDDFKFNVNLVLIDLMVRVGVIDRDGSVGLALGRMRNSTLVAI